MNMIESRMEKRGQGGFTLIELLVVVAILAVLGGAAIIGIFHDVEARNRVADREVDVSAFTPARAA